MARRSCLLLLLCAAATASASAIEPRDVQQTEQSEAQAMARLLQSTSAMDAQLEAEANQLRQAILEEIAQRATEEGPNRYRPEPIACPAARPRIRTSAGLPAAEKAWLEKRRKETVAPLRDLLSRIAIPGFDSAAYLQGGESSEALPVVSIACSGGGYRAMLNCAGVVASWDSRSEARPPFPINASRTLGGLLQSATFMSGLSGGSWLVGSLFTNNFTSVQDAMRSPTIWHMETNLLGYTKTEGSTFVANTVSSLPSIRRRLVNITAIVKTKEAGGFATSLTDYWARALAYQLVDAPDGGPGFTFSSIADDEAFASSRIPLPFIVANARDPGQIAIPLDAVIIDISPFSLGSYDAALDGYAPLRYVGSAFDRGTLPSNKPCIGGFDDASFVMGTSSSLFNQIFVELTKKNSDYVPSAIANSILWRFAIQPIIQTLVNPIINRFLTASQVDIAIWMPNPFKRWNSGKIASSDTLMLVDGGEDQQNVPFHPLLLNDRKVDVVFAVDSSSDTDTQWPNGTSPLATFQFYRNNRSNRASFPPVPGLNTFVNNGLNNRPTFFGCAPAVPPSPLIVYLPNAPYIYPSNLSTFKDITFTTKERDAMILNGWALGTQLDGALDGDWPVCVGCAILARSFQRTETTVPDKCKECFDRYCWDGRINETMPAKYLPPLKGNALEL